MNVKKFGGIEAGATLCVDKDGFERVLVVAKATFDIDSAGTCSLAPEQTPMKEVDEHYGDPESSSLRYECDFALTKTLVDVIVNGSAHALGGRPATEVVAGLALGPIRKLIRVLGDRVWEQSVQGCRPSAPKPFLSMPLVYERAFGGVDVAAKDPAKHVHESRNLAGVGYFSQAREDVIGTAVANLEHPDYPISDCTERSVPMGFGFVSRHWHPRATYSGTYDQAWRAQQFPFLPADFNELYYQGAPPDQQVDGIRGGEKVVLIHMTPEGRMEFSIPRLAMFMMMVLRSGYEVLTPRLDTLIIEPDARRCTLVWRANTKLIVKLTEILAVWVGNLSPGRLTAIRNGKRYLSSEEITAWK
jgi:hypothetical protein